MKGYIRKAAAFLAAALVAVSAAGCADKKEDEHDHGHNMAGVSAPDGDYSDYVEKELKPESSEVPIFITFRGNLAEDEEAAKVAEFYYAMSEKSVEYLEKSVQPDVLKMKLNGSTSADYLNVQYDFIKDSVYKLVIIFFKELLRKFDSNVNNNAFINIDSSFIIGI